MEHENTPPPHPAAMTALLWIERSLLGLVAVMTLFAAGFELLNVFDRGEVNLGDILMMLLYTEVIAMVAVFVTKHHSVHMFPILIALTAVARLIILQGKDMDPLNILIEAGAIFILAGAAWVMTKLTWSPGPAAPDPKTENK